MGQSSDDGPGSGTRATSYDHGVTAPLPAPESVATAIDLYWIPLGSGGNGYVRANGRIYEAVVARREHRRPLDLYHTALIVSAEGRRHVVENAWPSPDADGRSRGVVVEGPVFGRRIARLRPFRYEVRCWRDGTIPDVDAAVDSPQRLSVDPGEAATLLSLVRTVPPMVWGRDESGTGEMWNSNSVVAWVLARTNPDLAEVDPPAGGRAPGWRAGVITATRDRV